MIPDPDPLPCWLTTLILTTEGSTSRATASTDPLAAGSSLPESTTGLLTAVWAESLDWLSFSANTPAAPPTPAMPPSISPPISSPATVAFVGRAARGGSWVGAPKAGAISGEDWE